MLVDDRAMAEPGKPLHPPRALKADEAVTREARERPLGHLQPVVPDRVNALIARWKEQVANFAPRLGLDEVRVRCDNHARAVTEAEGARGVALEDTIYLHPERITPETTEGCEVLVHELVHIAQARLGSDSRASRHDAEAEAAEIARSVTRGGTGSPRRAIDLSRPAADRHAGDPPSDPVADGIEAGLARAADAAETAFAQLVAAPADRETIIGGLSASFADLVTASELLMATDGSDAAPGILARVGALSESIAKISHWVDGRPANASLVEKVLPVIRQVNRVRKQLGLGLLGALPTPALPLKVTEDAEHENAAYDANFLDLLGKLDKKFDALAVGADEFAARVKLTDKPEGTPLWAEIVKSLLIAVVGNLLGPVGKIVVGLGEHAGQMVEAITSDWAQAAAAEIASEAVASTETDERRDQAVFVTGLKLGQMEVKDRVRTALIERKRRGTLPAAELTKTIGELERDTVKSLAHQAYLEAAHAYAKLNAHRSLGVETDLPSGTTVSAMDFYFGQAADEQGRQLRADQTGARGVAELCVELELPEDGVCDMEIRSFNIHGLNQDMAAAALERAGSRIECVDLPMEIRFEGPGSGEARMVVDEIGRVRDSAGWDLIERYLPLLRGRQLRNPQPDTVLAILRAERIPEGAAV